MNRHYGFTLIELLVVVSIIAALVAIVVPAVNHARVAANRGASGANVAGLAKALHVFAASHADYYPGVYPGVEYGGIKRDPKATTITYGTGLINAAERVKAPATITDTVSVTRAFWTLIRDGTAQAGTFVSPNSTGARSDPTIDVSAYYDFTSGSCVSYAYQMPFGRKDARPSRALSAGMFVVGDRGPLFRDGDGGEDEGRLIANPQAAIPQGLTPAQLQDGSGPDFVAQKFNSPNERHEGQTLGRADGSAGFHARTTVGVNGDNVYTFADGNEAGQALCGAVADRVRPSAADGDGGPRTAHDTYLVP